MNHKINRSFAFEDRVFAKYQRAHEGVEQVGLLVDPSLPWLGASPDGLVMSGSNPQLIEIKSCRTFLGRRSPAWHQVQGAMAIATGAFQTPVTRCKLIDPAETYTIYFDEAWWTKFLERLKKFYFGVFLPMAARRILQKVKS
ncbi:NUP98 [Symbiodinium natans]|uniref:NUP98 protein n=1 Tax=Symbiodinium natans TaxID=878477 RepID=A0A812L2I3_9DINO|nr:NUP98 [Symbiodinium natans]